MSLPESPGRSCEDSVSSKGSESHLARTKSEIGANEDPREPPLVNEEYTSVCYRGLQFIFFTEQKSIRKLLQLKHIHHGKHYTSRNLDYADRNSVFLEHTSFGL